jgi:hypothetical protein
MIADLQLFGSIEQIKLAKKLADDIKNKDVFYIDELMKLLRNDLRKELGLSPVDSNITWLRFDNNKSKKE